ncbi:hypothetical protein, partial [Escherichia coli]|uniref:hypothetical protein n=1 Tax=Escherichia coli TaxID=562 RepID=UPI00141258B6
INNPPDADQIQIYANGAWTTYYAYDADGTGSGLPIWTLLAGGIADRGATVLPPGQGVFVSRPNPSIDIVAYGEVRENKFIRP